MGGGTHYVIILCMDRHGRLGGGETCVLLKIYYIEINVDSIPPITPIYLFFV